MKPHVRSPSQKCLVPRLAPALSQNLFLALPFFSGDTDGLGHIPTSFSSFQAIRSFCFHKSLLRGGDSADCHPVVP